MIKILESHDSDIKKITIETRDSEGQLAKLLDDIKKTAALGHTFDVIVDPDAETPRSYEIDGDGAFAISNIKSEKITAEAYNPNNLMKLSDIEGKVTNSDEIALKDIGEKFATALNELLTYTDELSKLYPQYYLDDDSGYDINAFVAYQIDTRDIFFSEGLDENNIYQPNMEEWIKAIKAGEISFTCKTLYNALSSELGHIKRILNKVKNS